MAAHRTTLVFDEHLWRAMKKVVASQGTTVSDWVSRVIRGALSQQAKRPAPWHLSWHTAPLGGQTKEIVTREQMYEFISRRF